MRGRGATAAAEGLGVVGDAEAAVHITTASGTAARPPREARAERKEGVKETALERAAADLGELVAAAAVGEVLVAGRSEQGPRQKAVDKRLERNRAGDDNGEVGLDVGPVVGGDAAVGEVGARVVGDRDDERDADDGDGADAALLEGE